MATTEYFKPGVRVFAIIQNRVHLAVVDTVTIHITADWQNRETVDKRYGVALVDNPGKNVDISAEDLAETREGLLAKL
jgi:hypothetical protein